MQVPLLNPYFDLFEVLSQQEESLQSALRKKLIWAFSWAIPNSDAIHSLRDYSPIIELGAGTGYWTWLLKQAGAHVLAYDVESNQPPHWSPVESGGPEILSNFSTHSLLLCWPPFNSKMASQSIQSYQGNTIIYIGEWEGRTADSDFHFILSQTPWQLSKKIKIPNWPGYSDQIYILQKLSAQ